MRSEQMTLADGRTLSWAVLGAVDSPNVLLHNHGTGSCRLEVALYDDHLAEIGLRVVAPERPGYGRSTPWSAGPGGPAVADWADDVAELVGALGLGRFAVSGYSSGGRNALGIAASPLLHAKVTRVVLRAGTAPDLPPHSEAARAIADRVGRTTWADLSADFAGAEAPASLAPADHECFADPAFAEAAMASLAEGSAQGPQGQAGDAWGAARPWGFGLAAVTQPVDVWHGDADTIVPVEHAHALHATLADSTLHVLPGEGHFSIGRHVPDSVAVLTAFRE